MSLFNTGKKKNSTLSLTSKLAQEIYGAIEKYGTAQAAFLAPDTNFDFSNCKLVWTEIKSLEAEVLSKMSGTYEISPFIPAVYDENEKLVSPEVPAVYYKPSTQDDLEKSLSSELLDIKTLVSDCVKYHPTFDEKRDFKTWLESFKETPEAPLGKTIPAKG